MYVIDLDGNEYPMQATITNENEVNGNQSLSTTIYASKVNKAFISDIQEMWRIVDHDNVEHKVIYAKRKGQGVYHPEYETINNDDTFFLSPTQPVTATEQRLKKSTNLTVEIKAIPLFFDDFDNDRIYERYDRHMTALEAFQKIFQGTNYDFSLADQFDAVQWEGFGAGETRIETFKRALERYKAEFRISGNMIYLERRIGRDTQFQYRYRLNASNIEQEIDANEMWTFARGYGDYGNEGQSTEDDEKEDWERANLIREYTSPLANVIGIRHAPPIKNGNITTKGKMDRELKALIDESLKISVSADIYDLQKQGYPVAQSEVGDRVFLIDERISLDNEVRVISQSKTRDWEGRVIDLNITFGSERISKRHQSQLNSAAKEINDLIAGRKKLPYSVLPVAEQAALKALNEARTELIFGNSDNGVQGIIAQEKDDPNRLLWLNSAGWMISTDGGATTKVAATADGIVADVITAGTLNADQVAIMGSDGNSYSYISGAYAEFRGTFKQTWLGDTNTYDIKTKVEDGYLRFRNDSENSSLYFSWNGISTFVDGAGGEAEEPGQTSGSIFWWDKRYSNADPATSGITIYSWGGTAALESERHHALVKSRYSTSIQSDESNIKINPYNGENDRGFTITKGSDYLSGKIMYGNGSDYYGGLRFTSAKKGRLEVLDEDNQTGRDTTITAGIGEFNDIKRRGDNKYVDIAHKNILRVGDSSSGGRVGSRAVYKRTYKSSPNMVITDNYTLGRSTSSERYKVNIDKQFNTEKEQLEHSKKIMKLDIITWYDKREAELLCDEIECDMKYDDENFKLEKAVGLTSEKVESAGFPEHVEYSDEGLEGVDYSRLWIHLIPVIKNQQARIEELEAKL